MRRAASRQHCPEEDTARAEEALRRSSTREKLAARRRLESGRRREGPIRLTHPQNGFPPWLPAI